MITQHFKEQIVMCYFIWFIECVAEHIWSQEIKKNHLKFTWDTTSLLEWRQNQGKMRKSVFKSIMPQIDYQDL